MVGDAASIDRMLIDLKAGLMVEQAVKHVRRLAGGGGDHLGVEPGATHEKPKAERPAFSGNYRSSPTLTGAAVLQPKHATAGQAQLPERSHASPLITKAGLWQRPSLSQEAPDARFCSMIIGPGMLAQGRRMR